MRQVAVAILGALLAVPAFGQRDFLTADEADQIREAQEPNLRLKTYIVFARQRLDQVEQLTKEEKTGRASLIHALLEQYTEIIDAMDAVVDDALRKKADLTEGIKAVSDAEKEFIKVLERVQQTEGKDSAKYEFALTNALEATRDSAELAAEDLGERAAEVAKRQQAEREKLESMMQPKDLEERRAAEKKAAEAQKKERKRPTLLKPGETVRGETPKKK